MLITKEVEIICNSRNITYLKEKGYSCEYLKPIIVKIEDLNQGSHALVDIQCDYCGKIISIRYEKYNQIISSDNPKHACGNCISFKSQETYKIRTGYESLFYNPEIQEKRKNTMIDRFGTSNISSLNEVKKKKIRTSLKHFGTKHPLQNKNIKEKVNNTNLEKYGYINPMFSEEVRNKVKQTCLDKFGDTSTFGRNSSVRKNIEEKWIEDYGVDNLFKLPEMQAIAKQHKFDKYGTFDVEKIKPGTREKIYNTLWENNTAPKSSQQLYLHNLLGGELNYLVKSIFLDIAFVEKRIYCEYDGSGHKLQVLLNQITEEDFKEKEYNRYYFLKNRDWKLIHIISTKDYLPSDEIIISLIEKAKEYLNTGHSWFEINIDEENLKCSQYKTEYDFGELRKIKKQTLDNQKVI